MSQTQWATSSPKLVRNSLVRSDGPGHARSLEKPFLKEEDLDNCREGQKGSRVQFQSRAKQTWIKQKYLNMGNLTSTFRSLTSNLLLGLADKPVRNGEQFMHLGDKLSWWVPSPWSPIQAGPTGWELLATPVAAKQKFPHIPMARGLLVSPASLCRKCRP